MIPEQTKNTSTIPDPRNKMLRRFLSIDFFLIETKRLSNLCWDLNPSALTATLTRQVRVKSIKVCTQMICIVIM